MCNLNRLVVQSVSWTEVYVGAKVGHSSQSQSISNNFISHLFYRHNCGTKSAIHSIIRTSIDKYELSAHVDRNRLVLSFRGRWVADELLCLPKYLNVLFYERRKFQHK